MSDLLAKRDVQVIDAAAQATVGRGKTVTPSVAA
jgi:hypothetical protein